MDHDGAGLNFLVLRKELSIRVSNVPMAVPESLQKGASKSRRAFLTVTEQLVGKGTVCVD